MKKQLLLILTLALFIVPNVSDAALPEGFSVDVVSDGLALPTTFDFAPDGRIFVAEKEGAVRIIKNGQLLAEPFMTLSDINTWVDRGLIGLALDPNFAENGWVYLSYTYENSPGDFDGPKMARIVRVQADGDTVVPGSMEVLVGTEVGDATMPSCNDFPEGTDCIPSDSGSHSAGGLRFGTDGMLYATLGDGAGFNSVDENAYKAQDLDWLTGKILRLNPDGTAPSDNPFFTGDPTENRSKIYAYGVRNSFRFDFRESTGDLYFGDVGWNSWEEINFGAPGANYGWPCREGEFKQALYECTAENFVDPIHSYSPGSGIAAVTGGGFSGSAYPEEYQDNYFFGDFHNNNLDRMLVSESGEVLSVETWLEGNAGGPVSVLPGPDGSIYFIAIFGGELRRVVHESMTSIEQPPIARDDSVSTVVDTAVTIPVLANDEDPNDDEITLVSASSPSNGVAEMQDDGTIIYTPDSEYVGEDTFTYIITDGGLEDDAVVSIDVRPGGDASAVDLVHQGVAINVPDPVVGQTVQITASVLNEGSAGPGLIDFELYDVATEALIDQKFLDNEPFGADASRSFEYTWLPERAGTYRLSIGYFETGWSGLHEWVDNAITFTVHDREPAGDPFALEASEVTVDNATPGVGDIVTITASVTNTGRAGSGLVNIEIFDDAGDTIAQEFFDSEAFAEGEVREFTTTWTPAAEGQFWAEVGTFGTGWTPFMDWLWHGASIDVGADSGGDPGAGVVVYDDRLRSSWENWSWETGVDLTNTTQVQEGSTAALVTYESEWAGFYLRTSSPVSVAEASQIRMFVHGGETAGQILQLKLIDSAGNIILEEPLPILTAEWSEITVELGDLPSGTEIQGLIIQGASGEIESPYYLDAVRFE